MSPIIITSCTKSDEASWPTTLLGQSIERLKSTGSNVFTEIYFSNTESLTKQFNKTINKWRLISEGCPEAEDPIIVFVHDDVRIDDISFANRLTHGLMSYHAVGVAGGTRFVIDPKVTPSWTSCGPNNGRGSVNHIINGDEMTHTFGPFGQTVTLDGLLIATRLSTLVDNNIRWDEQFDFHCYDMDLSLQFKKANLTMGTIPLRLCHCSPGNYKDPKFVVNSQKLIAKWRS